MKTLYISDSDCNHSVNAVYINGLRENGISVETFHARSKNLKRLIEVYRFYKKNEKETRLIFVGYDSPGLVIWMKLISKKPIIYNALCSVYERLVISRHLTGRYSLKASYYWVLDFFAIRLAILTLLETKQQVEFFKKIFFYNGDKLIRSWTGVDESKFYIEEIPKVEVFTVIFRGRLLPESGAEHFVKAAKILEHEKIRFIMLSFGSGLSSLQKLIKELHTKNLKLIKDFLPIEEVRFLMAQSHISIGQLSNHDRLNRTIPHKAYEALAMKLPYLTARNKGILELLTPGKSCLVCNIADPHDLAKQILYARDHRSELENIAKNGYELFNKKIRAKLLVSNLLSRFYISN